MSEYDYVVNMMLDHGMIHTPEELPSNQQETCYVNDHKTLALRLQASEGRLKEIETYGKRTEASEQYTTRLMEKLKESEARDLALTTRHIQLMSQMAAADEEKVSIHNNDNILIRCFMICRAS